MSNISKVLWFVFLLMLTQCKSNQKELKDELVEKDMEKQMIEVYKEGLKSLEEGDNLFAAKKFSEAEILYPQSKWASQALLMSAYSYYELNFLSSAIEEIDRFILKYPQHKNISYAHFLKAICYFESVVDEKKDLEPLVKSKKEFKYIIKNYPNSDFAMDSKYKLELIDNVLAAKEMYIGRLYLDKEKWIAAINRFKKVVTYYDTTVYTPEALHRLVEVYYRIGLVEESKKYASVLGYNYLSNQWYKETYRIYNKKYSDPVLKIKKNKKSLLEKFKSLF
jgi:outer membrane protein assembly factor BamD